MVDHSPLQGRRDSSSVLLAEVAVDGARPGSDAILTYAVPEPWRYRVARGQLVWVPLRRRIVLGLVVRLHDDVVPFSLKPIYVAVEPAFNLTEDQLETTAWLARETATTLFTAATPWFPPGVNRRAVEQIRLTDPDGETPSDLTPAQRRLVELLETRGEMRLDTARQVLGTSLASIVPALESRSIVEREATVIGYAPRPREQRFIRLLSVDPTATARSPKQQAVVEYLAQRARLVAPNSTALEPLRDVMARTGVDHAVVKALAQKGLIEELSLPRTLPQSGAATTAVPTLTAAQAAAWRTIEPALNRRNPKPLLLHGVTGSGKTEVYLRAVAWCLRHGRTAIVLVPEIALAAQVVRRFLARFPGEVAVLHSALPDAERYETWQQIAAGRFRVVVGPRSALFAPVGDIGLIVLDEEHDGAYKQDSEPRYHARTLAEHIAARHGAVVILGSATPSVDTTWRASRDGPDEVHRISLPSRVGPSLDTNGSRQERRLDLPMVEVVDTRLELHRGNASLLSERLRDVLQETIDHREQAILFLNRRGLATVVLCRSCGHTCLCPFCDVPLVYHADRRRLLCHRCNYRDQPPSMCQECGGVLNYFGAGTQRVEEEVRRLFPAARLLRWDQDSVRRNGGHERMLNRVEKREVDIVVGTQMIAKGLDLPLVTAIGVIHADTMLHLPDFRSGERTFQLLTQVAGRAGRRAAGSRVVVQSYTPAHYAIAAASRHDYDAFYAEEIDFRRVHRFPPFTRLVRYLYRHADETVCAAEADEMARSLARHAKQRQVEIDLLGPSPAFASRLRGKYQWQIVMRSADLNSLLDGLPHRRGWSVDVDPQSML